MLYGVFEIDPEHLCARRHQSIGRLVAHVENIVDHCLFCFFERAVFCSLLDEILDLIFCHSLFHMWIDPEKKQEEIR